MSYGGINRYDDAEKLWRYLYSAVFDPSSLPQRTLNIIHQFSVDFLPPQSCAAVALFDAPQVSGEQYAAQAREAAVQDAIAKAQQFAQLTGVTLDRLVYIAESSASVPMARQFDSPSLAFAEAAERWTLPSGFRPYSASRSKTSHDMEERALRAGALSVAPARKRTLQ